MLKKGTLVLFEVIWELCELHSVFLCIARLISMYVHVQVSSGGVTVMSFDVPFMPSECLAESVKPWGWTWELMRYLLGSHPPLPRSEEHLESSKEISHLVRSHVRNQVALCRGMRELQEVNISSILLYRKDVEKKENRQMAECLLCCQRPGCDSNIYYNHYIIIDILNEKLSSAFVM